jgi:hypothetical protein
MQSRAATISSESVVTPTRLVNDEEAEISAIRRADNHNNNLVIEDEASWDRAAVSPTSTSWSMNSCSIDDDGNTDSSSHHHDDSSDDIHDVDNATDDIGRCLLDLHKQGVLYKGVRPIISTIFTRYVGRNSIE